MPGLPPPLPPPSHGRLWVQLVLLGATLITTTLAGGCHYYSFVIDLATVNDLRPELSPTSVFLDPMFWVRGLWWEETPSTFPSPHFCRPSTMLRLKCLVTQVISSGGAQLSRSETPQDLFETGHQGPAPDGFKPVATYVYIR